MQKLALQSIEFWGLKTYALTIFHFYVSYNYLKLFLYSPFNITFILFRESLLVS